MFIKIAALFNAHNKMPSFRNGKAVFLRLSIRLMESASSVEQVFHGEIWHADRSQVDVAESMQENEKSQK